ncbi:hypothetical protein ANANG_G00111270, partial [Anguilla anguilla]
QGENFRLALIKFKRKCIVSLEAINSESLAPSIPHRVTCDITKEGGPFPRPPPQVFSSEGPHLHLCHFLLHRSPRRPEHNGGHCTLHVHSGIRNLLRSADPARTTHHTRDSTHRKLKACAHERRRRYRLFS